MQSRRTRGTGPKRPVSPRFSHSTMPKEADELVVEAIPLIAEDLRDARGRLDLTLASAAARAGLSVNRYRMLENGQVRKTEQNFLAMISAAGHLGLESVRVAYVDYVDQYMRVGTAGNVPPTIIVETFDSKVAHLRTHGHFVSPRRVLDFVAGEGIGRILDSRDRVDKMIVELWVTAIFALCFGGGRDCYVRLTSDVAPDTEVLILDGKTGALKIMSVEVTQYGSHSTRVADVIAKKLMKRYHDGTFLLVLVEKAEIINVADLYDFIRQHNRSRMRVVVIGGTEEVGRFKIVPWEEVTVPAPDEKAWVEAIVDTRDKRLGRCEYDGVVVQPLTFTSRFRHIPPVFLRRVRLQR